MEATVRRIYAAFSVALTYLGSALKAFPRSSRSFKELPFAGPPNLEATKAKIYAAIVLQLFFYDPKRSSARIYGMVEIMKAFLRKHF